MMPFRNSGKPEIRGRLLFGNSEIAANREIPGDMPLGAVAAWRVHLGKSLVTHIQQTPQLHP